MARYIDADKLIAHLKDEIKACKPVFNGRANGKSVAYGTELGLKSAISYAETLATADVVPKSEVIPCKIGDTVWGITKYSGGLTRKARKSTVSAMFFLDDMRLCIVARSISRGEWGKEIFATQEEAEAAIERCGQ